MWQMPYGFRGLYFPMNPDLLKRMTWIVKCGLVAYLSLMGEVNWKSNTTKYFIRANRFWIPMPPPSIWPWKMGGEAKPVCYFLGTYSNYWNMQDRSITFAHAMGGGASYPMGSGGGLAGEYIPEQTIEDLKELESSFNRKDLEWLYYSGVIPGDATDEERERLYKFRQDYQSARSKLGWSYEMVKIDHTIMQLWALKEKRKRRSDCFKRYYPVKPKTPRAKVKSVTPGQTFPGIPMNELTLPTPTAPSAGPRAAPEKTLSLTLTFGIKENVAYNALDLTLNLQEL